jgi:hypothetical protein
MSKERANINSRTITLKVNSVHRPREFGVQTFTSYDEVSTRIKADSLTALFVSLNPLRKAYGLEKSDFKEMKNLQNEAENILFKMQDLLKNKLQ